MQRLCLATLLIAPFLIALAGCAAGYDPPVLGDRAAPKYQADITRCRKQADTAATRKANATPQAAVAALFASSDPERQDVTTCMQQRGYALRQGG